jgi:predicted MFS family arabinose efflux permease
VDLRVSARPAVLWTNVASIMVGFAMFAGFVLATQILQAPEATGYGFGLSLIAAGVALLPMGGSMVLFSTASARLSGRFGPRTTLALGTGLLGIGNLGFATLPSNLGALIGVATVAAVGAALAYSAIPLLIMRAVPESETAAANSLNTLARQLGTSSCTAVAAAVTTASVVSLDGRILPSGFAYSTAFLAAGAAGLLAMVIALLTPAPAEEVVPTPDLAPTG